MIANTLATLSKKDKTKNLSNKKQKSSGAKQTNVPELSSFQDLAAYLMTALKQAAVVEVVSPEQHRHKFFNSKNIAELKKALTSVRANISDKPVRQAGPASRSAKGGTFFGQDCPARIKKKRKFLVRLSYQT